MFEKLGVASSSRGGVGSDPPHAGAKSCPCHCGGRGITQSPESPRAVAAFPIPFPPNPCWFVHLAPAPGHSRTPPAPPRPAALSEHGVAGLVLEMSCEALHCHGDLFCGQINIWCSFPLPRQSIPSPPASWWRVYTAGSLLLQPRSSFSLILPVQHIRSLRILHPCLLLLLPSSPLPCACLLGAPEQDTQLPPPLLPAAVDELNWAKIAPCPL